MSRKNAPPERARHIRARSLMKASEGELHGVVVEIRSGVYFVRTEAGTLFGCRTTRSTHTENPDSTLVVVGDRVRFTASLHSGERKYAEGVITLVAARRSSLKRSRERRRNRSGEAEHVLASNMDLLVIIASAAEPPFRPKLIDRYLAYAEFERLASLLVVNKIDLDRNGTAREQARLYQDIGYETLLISASTGEGVSMLKEKLFGKTSVFSGHSGVGKSTLINAMTNSFLPTGELSEKSGKGAHTTSNAVMLTVASPDDDCVGYVIDTPGIREFGLEGIAREELRHLFIEFRKFAPECAFSSCTHTSEPNCAVRHAVSQGEISPDRYESYLTIYHEAED